MFFVGGGCEERRRPSHQLCKSCFRSKSLLRRLVLLEEQEIMETMSAFFGGLAGGARRSNHKECFEGFYGSNGAKFGRTDMGVYGMALRVDSGALMNTNARCFSKVAQVVIAGTHILLR